MSVVHNLRVGTRLGLAFAAVIAVFLIVSTVVMNAASKLQDAESWNKHTYQVLAASDGMLKSMINMETGSRGFLLSGDEKFLGPWKSGLKSFADYRAEAAKLTSDNPTQQERLKKIQDRHDEFRSIVQSMIAARNEVSADKRTMQSVIALFAQARDKSAMDTFRELVGEFDAAERDLMAVRAAQVEAARSTMRLSILGGAIVAVLLGGLMAFLVTRSITRPLQNAVDVARRVAAGDLTSVVDAERGDETGALLRALKEMNDGLRRIVGNVRSGVDTISTGSQQIASGNTDLSQRTEEQASSLEETASSMEELASTVRQNAENAQQANKLAANASEVALKGGAVVGEVVQTMSSINESSKKIADIIGVIDGIAFQTNILALNAAVEAARAGEQGRGFAVVASEVRTLAQRSAGAAKEIKELISDSVHKVEAGTQLVDNAGKTMDEIVSSVRRVTEIMSDITGAAQEQSAGIEQVNQAVMQMDQVTQQNAALVEEAAAAAEAMREQAHALGREVAVFKLSNDAAPTPVAAPGADRARVEPAQIERRGPNRAKNVARLAPKRERLEVAARVEPKKTGTDDWSEF